MGRAITYCVQCSKRVTDAELDSGKAFRVGDRILCKSCAPDSVKVQTTKSVPKSRQSTTSTSLKAQLRSAAPPTPPPAPPADPRKRKILIGAGAAAVAALLALVAVLALRDGPPPAAPVAPGDQTPRPPDPMQIRDAKEASATADLEKARAFARSHPDDPAACWTQFNDLVWKWEGTDAARKAAKEAAAIKTSNQEKVKAWMAEANGLIKPLEERGELRAAAARLEGLKTSHPLVEWRLAVEGRVSDLLVRAVKEERKKAEAEKAAGGAGTPGPKTDEKAPSEEAKGYAVRWEAAVARATARDFAGAVSELERIAKGLKDEEVRVEAAQDVKEMKALAALYASALDALKKKPRGASVSLYARRPGGETARITGLILQIDAQRLEVRQEKGSVFVEWEDLASPSLVQGSKAGSRVRAELCLLDGEVESAKAQDAELEDKWWAYGGRARSRVPKPDPAEAAAREAFYAAEQGYRSLDNRAAAIEGYKALRADYAATSIAKAYAGRIAARAEVGKEYYFAPADFHAEGSFRLTKAGVLESAKDSDESDTLRNLADVEFVVLPNLTYRCWLRAGACCEETFAFYLQGTEVTDVDPKTRKKFACDPGSTLASLVKNSIRGLKKTHAEHRLKGAKEHPKTAARWEWIEIPLPKYATPGRKRLRFMTNQAGFSIGGAVISSTRRAAPAEAEMKDLDKDREVPEAPPIDPDLVAWWTFDDTEGPVAPDASGKGHDAKLVGPAQWAEGKSGGGVRFTANGASLRVEDAEDLRISGDLTLSFWMKKEGEAGDWSCLLGKGDKGQRNYCLWLEGNSRHVMFQQYGAGTVNLKSTRPVSDGVWTHVAATVEGPKATLYLNGVKDGEINRPGTALAGPFPVGMGWACDHSTFRGSLYDVRIYRRALAPSEILSLVEQGR